MSFEIIASNLLSGVLWGGILALIALGLSIVLGVMRLINLAHGEIMVAGAYCALVIGSLTGLDPLIALPLIAAIMVVVAVPLQQLLLAPLAGKGAEAPMMTTFAVSLILQNLFLVGFSADTRSIGQGYSTQPFSIGPISVPLIYVLGFVISVGIIGAVYLLVNRSAFGRDLRASALDPVAAASVGVNVRRVHALTFGLGAACAATGGVLVGIALSFTPTTGAAYLLTSFAIVVLGGMGSIFGTLVAGIVLGVIQSIGALVLGDGFRDLVGLVLFLAVLAVRPAGLFGRRT
ncbi:branched-chain amino acid ABC transporter permease [Roseibium litorale]|uniref:Branched-chain amino acid ABC transporter permease n=1 Tax=Roseibium litorale TaxID=2803841 RepID=A0ABR9CSL1_9HYPH|nr:branched-chain amino acid ABC transporter permease [Roseibium litorale]MBD8893395.1 branched-chain amino acid ABC transporter permease [Roseibium litorale]